MSRASTHLGTAVRIPTDYPGLPARFWSKVAVATLGQCWEWQACKLPAGYGQIRIGGRDDGRIFLAHCVAYAFMRGQPGLGLQLDHLCRNPSCCNPAHLDPVPLRLNTLRGVSPAAQRARQTHCKRGHPLSGDNLKMHLGKWRTCRTCVNAAKREAYHRQRRAAA